MKARDGKTEEVPFAESIRTLVLMQLPGEGAELYDAAVAMRDMMIDLGIAVDGGKDSLSMAALCPKDDGMETVKAPGTLVVTGYSTVNDIRRKLTPDFKKPGDTKILHLDLADGKRRLGGSALAQACRSRPPANRTIRHRLKHPI